MLRFVLSRLVQSLVVLLTIAALTFFLTRAAPGGPFAREKNASPDIIEQIKESYGLNDSAVVQFGNYLKGIVLHGDFGPSYKLEGRWVSDLIADSLPVSMQLGLSALVIALLLGVPIGILAAVKKNTPLDYLPMSLAMSGICLPTFVMGPLLSLFLGLKLGWFHAAGWYDSSDAVLPSLTLGLYYAAYIARMTRGGMLEILSQDFIRTARAKGVPETLVILRHSLKGGLVPVVAFLGPALAGMVTGSFVIENIFQIPGLGTHFIQSAANRDYLLSCGAAIVYGALLVFMNLVVDILQATLNPRLRLTE